MTPNAPAGRRFLEWQKALDSGDSAVIGDFINNAAIEDLINKNMPLGRVQQHLSIHNESGGYGVKSMDQSDEVSLRNRFLSPFRHDAMSRNPYK